MKFGLGKVEVIHAGVSEEAPGFVLSRAGAIVEWRTANIGRSRIAHLVPVCFFAGSSVPELLHRFGNC
jgi:hypothetical protein